EQVQIFHELLDGDRFTRRARRIPHRVLSLRRRARPCRRSRRVRVALSSDHHSTSAGFPTDQNHWDSRIGGARLPGVGRSCNAWRAARAYPTLHRANSKTPFSPAPAAARASLESLDSTGAPITHG